MIIWIWRVFIRKRFSFVSESLNCSSELLFYVDIYLAHNFTVFQIHHDVEVCVGTKRNYSEWRIGNECAKNNYKWFKKMWMK